MIINKPTDYDKTIAYGEFEPLELGGHICVIKKVEVTESKTGKPMLIINLDTAPQDKQPAYFTKQWQSDTREGKKWGCRVWQMVYDNDGKTNRGLKTFITAVEKSNPGFAVQWGEAFASCFTNKLVGGVFGREQYLNSMNEPKWSTKCVGFRSVEAVQKGVEVPKDKYLQGVEPKTKVTDDGFAVIDDGEDLPF